MFPWSLDLGSWIFASRLARDNHTSAALCVSGHPQHLQTPLALAHDDIDKLKPHCVMSNSCVPDLNSKFAWRELAIFKSGLIFGHVEISLTLIVWCISRP